MAESGQTDADPGDYLDGEEEDNASATPEAGLTDTLYNILAVESSFHAERHQDTARQTSIGEDSPGQTDSSVLYAVSDTKGMPTDPDVFAPGQSQWHLVGTWGLHAEQVWGDYTGSGILMGALDDGFQYGHPEFGNYRTDLDYDALGNDNDAAPGTATDRHGTAVLGTMIADDNGSGTVGVAFDADGVGIRQGFGADTNLADTVEAFQYALATGLDILNNSWGFTATFMDDNGIEFAGTDIYTIRDTMIDMVEQGRGGLGMNIVFSAGNNRTSGDNVNYHNLHNSPYTITVGAIDSDGTYSSFSTPGAAILTSAGGTLVYTTDRTGADGYSGGDYTNFSGTSAAAPIISGMIGLILEANPDLGWRDVQEIIAYSSQHNDPGSAGWQYNGAGNWNGGGLHFSHDYGFGAADAFTAVRLAETWTLQQTSANMITTAAFSAAPALAIPDSGTVQTTINVGMDIEIEHVIIHMDVDHTKAGDLIVTLISPDGTESILVNRPENGAFTTSVFGLSGIDFEMMSVAHWGESSAGTWTLRIDDLAGGNSGILNDWSIQFMGNNHSNDDLYIFTDDFGNFSGAELAARSAITDADGGADTLNLAAVTTASTINLAAGTGTVAGNAVTLAGMFENVYTGDGNDMITGNAAVNYLYGGRGNDTIAGSAGDDTLDGGAGTDIVSYADAIADFTFNFVNAVTVQISHTIGSWMDTAVNFENFSFMGISYTRAELESYGSGGALNPINGTAGSDSLLGTASGDRISGDAGNDWLYGRGGNDTVLGGNGDDRLYGDAGNDTLSGGTGKNYLFGGAGTDIALFEEGSAGFVAYRENSSYIVVVDTNAGSLYGKTYIGNDVETLTFDDVTINLSDAAFTLGGAGWGSPETVNGTAGSDTLNGTVRSDDIRGGGGNDRIYGSDGSDTLYGELGIDYLYGDAGDDTLVGGAGADRIYGGAGNDIFGFTTAGDGVDMIYDFAAGDKLNITDILSGFTAGSDDINLFVSKQETSSGALFLVDSNGGGDNFAQAFKLAYNNLSGQSVQDLLDTGALITNQSLA